MTGTDGTLIRMCTVHQQLVDVDGQREVVGGFVEGRLFQRFQRLSSGEPLSNLGGEVVRHAHHTTVGPSIVRYVIGIRIYQLHVSGPHVHEHVLWIEIADDLPRIVYRVQRTTPNGV